MAVPVSKNEVHFSIGSPWGEQAKMDAIIREKVELAVVPQDGGEGQLNCAPVLRLRCSGFLVGASPSRTRWRFRFRSVQVSHSQSSFGPV